MNKRFNYFVMLLFTFGFISCGQSNEPELSKEVPTILVNNISKADETAEFFIINNTDEEFYYEGWSKTSPIYGFEAEEDTEWSYCGPYWCGTGLSSQILKPYQKVKIVTSLAEFEKYNKLRMVIEFKRSDSEEWIQVTSKEINFK